MGTHRNGGAAIAGPPSAPALRQRTPAATALRAAISPDHPPAHTGTLLVVGTPETARQITSQLACLGVRPAGCVIVGDYPGPDRQDRDITVLGDLETLGSIIAERSIDRCIVSLPATMSAAASRARTLAEAAGATVRAVPAPLDLLRDALRADTRPGASPDAQWAARPGAIDPVRLIGRRAHTVDDESLRAVLAGKRILITGAGGSIGSELARLCARCAPEHVVLMDRSENALFEIDRLLALRNPAVPRSALLHDVADEPGTLAHLQRLRPHIVLHAAAHKHVPLMEDHPAHAVVNNVLGTKSIADAAAACGAQRFVMISSDKAVNPSSVMGATKRLAEVYVRRMARDAGPMRASMVRFGNVLGSACSVLTIWSSQIADGGPITVTDPRMTRYFMTIPEAAALVLASMTLDPPVRSASAAPVYVLDMGEPVRIVDLAARFARAHGLEPALDLSTLPEQARDAGPAIPASPSATADSPRIRIVFTGARPGEKLHEQLAYDAERLLPTPHPGIRAWLHPDAGGDDAEAARSMIEDLRAALDTASPAAILEAVRRNLPPA